MVEFTAYDRVSRLCAAIVYPSTARFFGFAQVDPLGIYVRPMAETGIAPAYTAYEAVELLILYSATYQGGGLQGPLCRSLPASPGRYNNEKTSVL